MSTYQLGIDGTSAETGAKKIVKSFDDIKAAAERMEGGVSAAARKASSSFNAMANTRGVSQQVISAIRELSSVMSNFKGPSSASVTNALNLLNGLKAVGSLRLGGAAGITGFLGAISGFKGPSAASSTNTTKLLGALGKFGGIGGSVRGVVPLLSVLTGFKGPSSAATRNVQGLLTALQNFKAPAGLAGVARAFDALARSASNASAAIGKIKTLSAGSTNINVNTRQSSGAIAQLTKEHNLLHSAIFKTQTLYRSLGGIFAGRAILSASGDVVRIKAQLEAATGSVQQARVQFGKLTDMAQRMGLEITSLARSYGFFLGSIKGTNVTFSEAEDIFRGFSTAARALQLSTSDVDGVFRALGQIMSKGKLQAEELRGQLGDRLPGAFVRFARALDLTKPGQLDDALKKGAISGDRLKKAILEVSRSLEIEFAVAADKMADTVDAAFNRLRNAFTFAASDLGKSGLNEAMKQILNTLTAIITSKGMDTALNALGAALKLVADNIRLLSAVVITSVLVSFGRWVVAIGLVTRALAILRGAMAALAFIRTVGIINSLIVAFTTLNAVMRANVIGLVITALGLLTFWMLKSKKATDEHLVSLRETGSSSAIAANGIAAFTAELANNNSKLDQGNELLRERIRLNIINQQDAYKKSRQDISYRAAGSVREVKDQTFLDDRGRPITFPGGKFVAKKEFITVNGRTISDPVILDVLKKTGGSNPKNLGVKSQADYNRLYGQFSRGGAYAQSLPKDSFERQFLQQKIDEGFGYLETLDPTRYKMAGMKLGIDPQGGRNTVFNDPDRIIQPPGLSGEAPEKSGGAGKKGRTPGAGVDEVGNRVQRVTDALHEMKTEISASDEAIKQLSDKALDTVAAQARATAINKVEDFEKGLEPLQKVAATVKLAQQLKSQGLLDATVDISSYDRAKDAIIEYTAALAEANERKKKDAGLAASIRDLEEENRLRAKTVDAIAKGGVAMEAANTLLEAETAAQGTSIENRQKLIDAMTIEINKRNEINRAIEQANAIREARTSATVESEVAGLYGKGYTEDELNYYRELYTERQRLLNDGYTGERLREMLLLKQGTLDLAEATRLAQKEEEKLRQLAQDQADAVVNAFKEGVDSGQSFLKTIKNIFTDLKNILLDFVLYNPLREFLRDTFAQMGPGNSRAGGVYTATDSIKDKFQYPADLGSIFDDIVNRGGTMSLSPSQLSTSPQVKATAMGVTEGMEKWGMTIGVDGKRIGAADTYAPIDPKEPSRGSTLIQGVKGLFDWKKTQDSIKTAAGTLGKAGAILEAGGKAFAAFSLGKGIGKALGLGRTGSNILGGAAAGFSVGGPVGAAIGAVAGLALSVFGKKKIASSYGGVTVDAQGLATGASGSKYGGGKTAVGAAAAKAGANLFNQFAIEYDATLRAGNYGTFGRRKFKGSKEEQSFYSATGQLKKGKPVGTEGVDYVKGSDSEVQAFALRKQIQAGQIQGLSQTFQTIGKTSTATTMEELQSDFAVGRAYDEFIRASFQLSDMAEKVRTLDDNLEKLKKQSTALGLSESKLADARERLVKSLRKEFDYSISQGILGITDPVQGQFNDLLKEYREAVENGMAVGGDLLNVEKLYGLKRVELAKDLAQEQVNVYKDLLTSLTASPNSPLNAETVLANSQVQYRTLASQIQGGDLSGIDKLSEYTQNYLNAAREVNASSSGYFDIFNEVTSFLEQMSALSGTATGTATELPSLPSLDAIVAEINAKNQELIDVNKSVGIAVVETGSASVTELQNMGSTLDEILAAIQANGGVVPSPSNIIYDGSTIDTSYLAYNWSF